MPAAGRSRRQPQARKPSVTLPRLTIRAIRSTPVTVPLNYVLGTSAAAVREAPLLLVDLETNEGVTGHAYQFCYRAAAAPAIAGFLDDIADAVKGQPVAPADLWAMLSKRHTLIGVEGIVRMAMSLVDVAAWDALARAAGTAARAAARRGAPPDPRVQQQRTGTDAGGRARRRSGAAARRRLPCRETAARLRRRSTKTSPPFTRFAHAFPARWPSWLTTTRHSRSRKRCGAGRALDGEGLAWIEEPVRHDDFAGCAALAKRAVHPGADWRELLPGVRHAEGDRRPRLRPRDARPRAHRRHYRLAARERAGRGGGAADVVASLSRSERPSARGHADGALARVCGLDEPAARSSR